MLQPCDDRLMGSNGALTRGKLGPFQTRTVCKWLMHKEEMYEYVTEPKNTNRVYVFEQKNRMPLSIQSFVDASLEWEALKIVRLDRSCYLRIIERKGYPRASLNDRLDFEVCFLRFYLMLVDYPVETWAKLKGEQRERGRENN